MSKISNKIKEYDFRNNLIIDPNNPILIQKAWRDRFSEKSHWNAGYGGYSYLSRRNSEDALTWNIFRTLQKRYKGIKLISEIFKIDEIENILFWGCDVENFCEEQQLLNILIRIIDGRLKGTMTEPDLVFITKKEVVFIECKLNNNGNTSPWRAKGNGAYKRFNVYKDVCGFNELSKINDWQLVYQLIRHYIYAKSMAKELKKIPIVIPLINYKHKVILQSYYNILLNGDINSTNIFKPFVTWQEIRERLKNSSYNWQHIISKIDVALN